MRTSIIQQLGRPVDSTNPLYVTPTVPSSTYTAGATSTLSFTRTADTTAYAAGDVIGINASGSAGSAIHTFTSVGPAGTPIVITGADLTIGLTAVPAGMSSFRLHLYTASPTAILDNAAFDLVTADRGSHLGFIDLGTLVDYGSTLYTSALNVNLQTKLADSVTSLFGELVTVGGYTPASGTAFQVRLRTIAL
jgi:hypothetical protein